MFLPTTWYHLRAASNDENLSILKAIVNKKDDHGPPLPTEIQKKKDLSSHSLLGLRPDSKLQSRPVVKGCHSASLKGTDGREMTLISSPFWSPQPSVIQDLYAIWRNLTGDDDKSLNFKKGFFGDVYVAF